MSKARGKKVYVGISGGVDSSVSAALLKKAGYDVIGVFIKVWQPDWLECSWREERRDAMRVAAHLDIPFMTLDLEREYKRDVADYMIAEYAAGRTPNPDVMCNKSIKFGAFYDWAMKNGADYVATGHYAQITVKEEGKWKMEKGADANKDQSYFLWTLREDQLPHVLFPIGHLLKPEVRKLASKLKLPTAEKKDSQGICFIGMVDMKDFLAHYITTEPGNVLDRNGEVIGTHPGALLFTIGERHGFTITKKTPEDRASYVVSKDIANNTLTVSDRHASETTDADVLGHEVILKDVNWVSGAPIAARKYQARSRYRQELQEVEFLNITENSATVTFSSPQETLTSGQSIVVYDNSDNSVCLGGGIIV